MLTGAKLLEDRLVELQHSVGAQFTCFTGTKVRRYEAGANILEDRMAMHTSAYVSIRQHTSAYVSIRQHTSDIC